MCVFVNGAILLIAIDIPAEKVDSCCCLYSMKDSEFGAHWPIFIISCGWKLAMDSAQAPPDHKECVPICSIRIPLTR